MYSIVKAEVGSQEWHALRREGIGGSDAPKALGLSKWGTPLSLYMEKRGESDPVEETWEMARGKALEPLLRQNYSNTTGRTVLLPQGLLRSNKYPFMFYNPDGITEDKRLVEFKTAQYGKEWGDVESDDIPQDYLIQVQHGLIVTGLEVCDINASIAGQKPKPFLVEKDKELQEMIIEREATFWGQVTQGIQPEPMTAEDVAALYKTAFPGTIPATQEIIAAWAELKEVRSQISTLEETKETLGTQIKAFMGERDTLVDEAGMVLCTWKARKGAARIDSERLRTERPEIAAEYTKVGEAGRTFLVK